MKVKSYKYPEFDELILYPLGDLHIGAPESKWEKALNRSFAPNEKIILVGDIFDLALKRSLSDVYKATMNPMDCFEMLTKSLLPIKEHIIGIVAGNHEDRMSRDVGFDLLKLFEIFWNIPYSAGNFLFDISIGQRQPSDPRGYHYVVCAGHGAGGGRTYGGKVNAGMRLVDATIPDADIYITGHTHSPSYIPTTIHKWDSRNKRLLRKIRYHFTIPAWLEDAEYGEKKLYQSATLGDLRIKLSGKEAKRINFEM